MIRGFRIEGHAMAYETINVTPVTPRIGADVEGIMLAKPLSNRQVEELHQALAEHQVLFFRNQPLDPDSHKRLGRYFGELHIHPSTPGPETGNIYRFKLRMEQPEMPTQPREAER